MGRRARQVRRADIDDVFRQIEQWRHTRVKLSPMPEELWEAAVAVARDEGLYATARRLRLNYQSLKARVDRRPAPLDTASDETVAPSFIELAPMAPKGLGAAASVIELSNGAGERLSIQLAAGAIVDVVGLAEIFWGRTR
jgi:hypothetical protein